jgi:hypothetical protein
MSLIEVLIATAILAIVILAVLGIYDAARGAFKKGENAANQQESVRIAYDRITADLRMLGYNTNPDGNTARPDEQLEVGLDHAIIFRGDFDAEDKTGKATDHEVPLAGGAFDVVSTGNDEVVGYVLEKPDGTGPDTITFQADVDDQPRDGNVTTVTVNNVVLNPTSPPYTLYKISLNNNVATCCSGDFIVRTPVVENVRNLTFQYFDPSGAAPIPAPGSDEAAATKTTRAGITKFNVSLIGMTKDPDMNYNDATDPAAKTYRKFELRGDVVPRNMRMKGVQDLSAVASPPSQPATPTLVAGHCAGLLATWTANPTRDAVVNYKVNYSTTPGGTPIATIDAGSSPYFLAGLTTGTTYYVSLQAVNTSGLVSAKSGEASATVTNTNTPSAPTGASATNSLINHVSLNWAPVTTNTASVPAADPAAPACRDLAGYRVYRGDTSSVTTVLGNRVADETQVKAPGEPPHIDATTINCHNYFYKLTAVDTCGTESAATSAVSGHATTTIAPAAPTNTQAFSSGVGQNIVNWTAVTKDVNGNDIKIGAYDIYRSSVGGKGRPASSAVFPGTPIGSSTTLTYTDAAVPAMSAGQSVFYAVKAKDECINYSALSAPSEGLCAFSGLVTINPPIANTNVAGVVPTTVSVSGGTDTYSGVTITYTHSTAGVTRTWTSNTNATSWTDTGWLASPAGSYTITAVVTNSIGCMSTTSIQVTAGSAVGCCLSLFPTTASTASCASGSTKCKEVTYKIGNNQCLTAVSVTSMTVSWTDYSGNKPQWQTAKFNGTNIAGVGSWTTTYVGTTNQVGTATKSNFTAPSPQVPYTSSMTNGNTTPVTYVFNNFTDAMNGGNRVVDVFDTNQFIFTLLDSAGTPSGITTTCNLRSLTVQ